MGLTNVGQVDIYADTGVDQWAILKERIEREIKSKKVKDGDHMVMKIDFGTPLMIEIKVKEMPQERLL